MRGTFGAACAAAERLEPRCLLAAAVTPLGAAGVTPLSTAVSLGGAHYFLAGRSAGGAELWRTDGTAAGTSLVAAVPEPLQASYAFDAWAGRPCLPTSLNCVSPSAKASLLLI